MVDTQLPFLGVILCCTSIPPEQRSELASIASQMGATHRLDLTSDVTHLIVGDPDTPKYKFVARERLDVRCMLPSWIDSLRAKWLEGGEINVEALEGEHKLPTFHGLRICVTGFDDLEYRKRLEDHITDNGGEYRGNLTKDITHLIAKEASGQKYNYAAQWNIKTVSVEWLDQSLERGMILDETLYHLALPVSERGRNAWIRRTPSTTSLGKRSREQELGLGSVRKLRRTASAKLSSQNLGLWADINLNEAKVEERKKDESYENKNIAVKLDGSKENGSATKRDQQNIKVEDEKNKANPNFDPGTSLLNCRLQKTGLFQDKTFILNGFDEKKVPHFAKMTSGFEKISVCSTAFQGIDLLHVSKAVKLMAVTANWLWDCISQGGHLPFDSYLVQAVKSQTPISKEAKSAKVIDKISRVTKSDGKKVETPERWVPKTLKKPVFSDDERRRSLKEAPIGRGIAGFDEGPRLDESTDLPTTKADEPTPIYLDDDETPMLFDESTTTLDPPEISAPLREITPNSSPPKHLPSPIKEKPPTPTPAPQSLSEDPTLGPAISSLLAHHQRNNSAAAAAARPSSSNSSDQPRMYRRRRQLLGRAPSNLSSHSINLSRASSVDTMNTDGLGTPLEPSNRSKSDNNLKSSSMNNPRPKADFPTFYSADQNEDPDREEPPLQMTQLGYEDPDVAAWRERVAIKMSGGKVKEKTGTTPAKGKAANAAAGSLGIAKRTRLATGGR
ncbi:DNA replication regulator DPB11, partial [Lecanoromycetidae sp. Uapishka_2]